MKTLRFFPALFFLLAASVCFADGFFLPPYYSQSDFLRTTPGVNGDGAASFFNPAVWALSDDFEMQFFWNDLETNEYNTTNYAFTLGAGNLGFGFQHWDYPVFENGESVRKSLDDYHIALGFGDEAYNFGIGYGWSKGDITDIQLRDDMLFAGFITRPFKYLSVGLAGHWAMNNDDFRGILDAGVRPFGNSWLTLFGDASMTSSQRLEDILWSAGVEVEPVKGISVFGKYFENETFTAGLSFTLSELTATVMPRFDKESEHAYTTYGVRLGVPKPDPFTPMMLKDKMYLRMDFKGPFKYQRFVLFDQKGYTLMEVLDRLEKAKNDERVAGIAININEEMYGSWEMIWEVREKIKEVREAGKKVVVFLERGGMQHYYLASAADKIMVDPETMTMMLGFNLGRTFYKNMLEKIGVGFDEWRFYKYKSAAEALSREEMSEADKEQRKALIDEWYGVLKSDICESRGITHESFDDIVNNVVILNADSLLKYNLADTTGRWDEMSDYIKEIEGDDKKMIGGLAFEALQPEYEEWGIEPKIAVIYALGPCSMNSGINANRLRHVIKSARNDKHIKGVVFRADSPGGDILPSDIVAVELKKTAEEKPVIVSQGFVAGSGGYWISMYGDQILASPWTITGSIGVIGGWIYDKGLGGKLGLTYDHTQAGDHADLGGGIVLPLLGAQIPNRNLTEMEMTAMEKMIRGHYQNFIQKVAEGRGMEKEAVHEVAQGRVWTGTKGKEIGLVDQIGGLEKAIQIVREKAGIKSNQLVEIVEMPEKGLLNPNMFQPSLLGVRNPSILEDNYELQYLKALIEAEGRPLLMTPPDMIVR